MEKSLDRKLREIHHDPQRSKAFIIADAKDADMGFGIGAPGLSPERHDREFKFKSLAEYREQIRQVIAQGIVDIVLMSNSTSEQLTLRERLFDHSSVTPAIRANDATDVHVMRHSRIPTEAARPFRSANLDHAQCGHIDCEPIERSQGADLGLYSVTFNNDCELDRETLNAYRDFRAEAERKGFRHFLEVFNPNLSGAVTPEQRPDFMNDVIARTLAGVTSSERPIFLKIAWQGPRAMEELVHYDPHLVVGVLGGAAGTTRDAFQLLHDVRRYGGRAALFGRKINQAECQLAFIEFLRLLADDVLQPEEAVRAYHDVLQRLQIPPHRPLELDLQLQTLSSSYGGSEKTYSLPAARVDEKQTTEVSPDHSDSKQETAEPAPPVFSKMTNQERLEYHLQRINRSL